MKGGVAILKYIIEMETIIFKNDGDVILWWYNCDDNDIVDGFLIESLQICTTELYNKRVTS